MYFWLGISNDLIVGVKDRVHPDAPFIQLTDEIPLRRRVGDQKDGIEASVSRMAPYFSGRESALAPHDATKRSLRLSHTLLSRRSLFKGDDTNEPRILNNWLLRYPPTDSTVARDTPLKIDSITLRN
jgi:hypothetical protein